MLSKKDLIEQIKTLDDGFFDRAIKGKIYGALGVPGEAQNLLLSNKEFENFFLDVAASAVDSENPEHEKLKDDLLAAFEKKPEVAQVLAQAVSTDPEFKQKLAAMIESKPEIVRQKLPEIINNPAQLKEIISAPVTVTADAPAPQAATAAFGEAVKPAAPPAPQAQGAAVPPPSPDPAQTPPQPSGSEQDSAPEPPAPPPAQPAEEGQPASAAENTPAEEAPAQAVTQPPAPTESPAPSTPEKTPPADAALDEQMALLGEVLEIREFLKSRNGHEEFMQRINQNEDLKAVFEGIGGKIGGDPSGSIDILRKMKSAAEKDPEFFTKLNGFMDKHPGMINTAASLINSNPDLAFGLMETASIASDILDSLGEMFGPEFKRILEGIFGAMLEFIAPMAGSILGNENLRQQMEQDVNQNENGDLRTESGPAADTTKPAPAQPAAGHDGEAPVSGPDRTREPAPAGPSG